MIKFPLTRINLDTVDSTNNYAKKLIREGKIGDGVCIIANEQTQGRGRLGRIWQSSEESLCMTVAFKHKFSEGLTLIVALGLYDALSSFSGDKKLMIKWPNDIICQGKKLCGILCERVSEYNIIGIGVNVNNKYFDAEFAYKATSLYRLCGKETDKLMVSKQIELALCRSFTTYGFELSENVINAYKPLCANIGKNTESIKGKGEAVDIGNDGSLVVKTAEGKFFTVNSGEVIVNGIY